MKKNTWPIIEGEVFKYNAHEKIENYISHIGSYFSQPEFIQSEQVTDNFFTDYSKPYNTYKVKWIDNVKHESYADIDCYKPLLNAVNFDALESLREELPHFSDVIDFYIGHFVIGQTRSQLKYQTPFPVLLLGDAGIGKTYFAKKISQIFNTGYQFIDANGLTANFILSGSSAQWKSPSAGLIFKTLLKSNTISPVIVFDEIDKLSPGKNYDPYSTFHQLLEPNNAKEFHDEFLDTHMDASKIIYILTANDERDISRTLLSRMQVFTVNRPAQEHMKPICQQIYQDILGGSSLFTENLSEEALTRLSDLTPREVRKVLSENIFRQASRLRQASERIELKIELSLPDEKMKIGF